MDSLRADVVEYNTRTRTWTSVLTDSEETPCRFYGQSVCTYGDNLLLFGGSTGLHYSNDLYEYNVCSNRWKKLLTTGKKPSPRYGGSQAGLRVGWSRLGKNGVINMWDQG